jgi:putative hydrolases of HD superfamily
VPAARDVRASSARLAEQVAFALEADRLKSVVRQTPLLDSTRRETDGEHSWHVALIALVFREYADPEVDIARVIAMLLVHDLVEIDAGDTFIYDDSAVATQQRREAAAAARIFGLLPPDQRNELAALWEEFEAQRSPEARFAKAIDRFQPLLHNYFTRGGTWKNPGVTRARVIDRKRVIERGSPRLWAYAQELIDDAVAQGFLAED